MNSGADFSECRTYRYALWRIWDEALPRVGFIGLNPSTADETVDDPTIRRCIGFAKDWGYGGIYMLNLFAFRATLPSDMKESRAPIGPANDTALLQYANKCDKLVACWGVHGEHRERNWIVRHKLLKDRLWHLGLTKDGHPKHPLYLKKDTPLTQWI